MPSSRRERHGRKERRDTLRIDAYDPQLDPDSYDGYKFHKTYETIGDGRRHIWIRRNNAENPEWTTYVNGSRVLPRFTVDENEPDIHLYETPNGTIVRCSPEDVVHHHQIVTASALYSGTPNLRMTGQGLRNESWITVMTNLTDRRQRTSVLVTVFTPLRLQMI